MQNLKSLVLVFLCLSSLTAYGSARESFCAKKLTPTNALLGASIAVGLAFCGAECSHIRHLEKRIAELETKIDTASNHRSDEQGTHTITAENTIVVEIKPKSDAAATAETTPSAALVSSTNPQIIYTATAPTAIIFTPEQERELFAKFKKFEQEEDEKENEDPDYEKKWREKNRLRAAAALPLLRDQFYSEQDLQTKAGILKKMSEYRDSDVDAETIRLLETEDFPPTIKENILNNIIFHDTPEATQLAKQRLEEGISGKWDKEQIERALYHFSNRSDEASIVILDQFVKKIGEKHALYEEAVRIFESAKLSVSQKKAEQKIPANLR